ncbi:MAG TPA: glycine zipper 2TM domain-containing protein [Ramlibacter sp.]
MRHSRTLSLAGAVALCAGLAACASSDPYGPNNYPVSDINPNPGGVALAPGNPATGGYVAQGPATTYVAPGSTTTYVVPAGSTVVAPAGTYVVPGTSYAVPSVEYGRVTNVALLSRGRRVAGNTGAGAVIGGVAGGLLGNTVGGGVGRIAATIVGAMAGAAVGNTVENNNAPRYAYAGPVYRVWIQTDSGVMRTYDVGAYTDLHPGDRVRIDNGQIYLG